MFLKRKIKVKIVVINLAKIFLVLIISGCTTTEVLPGLCYNDKDLTHLCEIEPEVQECIQKGECKYA